MHIPFDLTCDCISTLLCWLLLDCLVYFTSFFFFFLQNLVQSLELLIYKSSSHIEKRGVVFGLQKGFLLLFLHFSSSRIDVNKHPQLNVLCLKRLAFGLCSYVYSCIRSESKQGSLGNQGRKLGFQAKREILPIVYCLANNAVIITILDYIFV